MTKAITVSVGGHEFNVTRARLGGFIALQRATRHLDEAVRSGDNGAITDGLYEYLSAAIPELGRGEFNEAPFFETFGSLREIRRLNRIPKAEQFSILRGDLRRKTDREPWEYDDRSDFLWVHTIADTYHWGLQEILNLWPEEAVAYLTEIMATKQGDREFLYALSEVAYPFDRATKRQTFKPLERPGWMVTLMPGKKPKNWGKVLRRVLPVGRVEGGSQDGGEDDEHGGGNRGGEDTGPGTAAPA